MANKLRGEVPLEADGKVWIVRYSINALCELETATGCGATEFIGRMQDQTKVRMTDLRTLVWCGLRDKQPDVTQEKAGEIASAAGLEPTMAAIQEAIAAAFPQGEAVAEAKGRRKVTA